MRSVCSSTPPPAAAIGRGLLLPPRLIAVALALLVAFMACGGGGGDTTTVVPPPTATPTTPPITLRVDSSPQGARVELNPQYSSDQAAYLPGTGHFLGLTPLTATLQPSEVGVPANCGTLIIFVYGIPGYYGAVDNTGGCLSPAQNGAPSFAWFATLEPCPAAIGPSCGNPST